MGANQEVGCPKCGAILEKDNYTVKKGNGDIVVIYYCKHCCKVCEVKIETPKN